jgi:hypothetical protein
MASDRMTMLQKPRAEPEQYQSLSRTLVATPHGGIRSARPPADLNNS